MSNILRPVKSDIRHEQHQFLKGRAELMNGNMLRKILSLLTITFLTAVAMMQTAEEQMRPALEGW